MDMVVKHQVTMHYWVYMMKAALSAFCVIWDAYHHHLISHRKRQQFCDLCCSSELVLLTSDFKNLESKGLRYVI